MNDKTDTAQEAKKWSELGASKGGRARANVLTPDERKEIARQAARARWLKAGKLKDAVPREEDANESSNPDLEKQSTPQLPFSMFRGALKLGDLELECHVLDDGRRVLTQREVVRAISGGRESGNLGRYLDRNPLTSKHFDAGPVIHFAVPRCSDYRHWVRGFVQGALPQHLCSHPRDARAQHRAGVFRHAGGRGQTDERLGEAPISKFWPPNLFLVPLDAKFDTWVYQ